MKFYCLLVLSLAGALCAADMAAAKPSVYLAGTVRYDPAKTWNSYIILSGSGSSSKMIDRNGNLVHEWDRRAGAQTANPAKVLPGGYLITQIYPPMVEGTQDGTSSGILDFDSNIMRRFSKYVQVDKPARNQPREDDGKYWAARQTHDVQIEGMSTGYYSPAQSPNMDGRMLMLVTYTTRNEKINRYRQLRDAEIIIVDKEQNILWRWKLLDHFDELGLDKYPEAMKAMNQPIHPQHEYAAPADDGRFGGFDWAHVNCVSWLGENHWYDEGDKRFHPDNIILDMRETGHMLIIDHESGDIVWKVSPPFVGEDAKLGKIIGAHHTHMIPRGLPGEGNILVFNNGGISTYFPELASFWTRVMEINPVTKEIVWEYSGETLNRKSKTVFNTWLYGDSFLFSPYIGSAQRLPNGNTLITEGSSARIIEVTTDMEIVWEYVSPYHYSAFYKAPSLYRSYAVPYEWVPQLKKPRETAVIPPYYGTIVLPDVEGNIPDYKPVMDKSPAYFDFDKPFVVKQSVKK